jgi:hypothetical protein
MHGLVLPHLVNTDFTRGALEVGDRRHIRQLNRPGPRRWALWKKWMTLRYAAYSAPVPPGQSTGVPLDCALTGSSSSSRVASSCDGTKPLLDRVGSRKTIKMIQDIPLGHDIYNVQHFTQPFTEPAANPWQDVRGSTNMGLLASPVQAQRKEKKNSNSPGKLQT